MLSIKIPFWTAMARMHHDKKSGTEYSVCLVVFFYYYGNLPLFFTGIADRSYRTFEKQGDGFIGSGFAISVTEVVILRML